MDNSLRDAMMQMVSLQAQSLNAINQLTSTVQMNGASSSLPPASALTSYTNYAAPYQGPTNPFAPSPQAQARFQSYASQIAPNGLADAVKQYVNTPAGQVSPEQRQMMGANLGASLTNTSIAGAGAAAGGIGSAVGYALMPGFLPSIAAGGLAGLGAGAITSVALDQAQQSQAINKFLLQNSYRFINPMESVNDRGIAGFSQSQRWQAASFLRNFDVKANISDDQTMQLLQGFTEGGLLKSSSDLATFEKKFSQLTDYVKRAAITLNTTFKQTTDLMADLEKRGLLSTNFDYFASSSKALGTFTGQSAAEAMQSAAGLAGSMATAGSTTSYQASTVQAGRYLAVMGQMNELAKANQATDPTAARVYNAISNLGGVDGAMQSLVNTAGRTWDQNTTMAMSMAALGTDSQGKNFSMDRYLSAVSGYSSQEQIAGATTRRIEQLKANGADWDIVLANAKYDYMSQDAVAGVYSFWDKFDPRLGAKETMQRYRSLNGYSDADIELISNYGQVNTPEFIQQYESAAKREQALATRNANLTGLKGLFWDAGRSVGNFFGNTIGQPLAEFGTNVGQTFMDIINGGKVDTLTLSGSSYTSGSIASMAKTAESAARGAGLLDPKMIRTTQGTFSVLNDSVSGIQKSVADMMKGLDPNSAEYAKYKNIQDTYSILESTAKGFTEGGQIIASGLGGWSNVKFSALYNHRGWSGMSASEMADLQKKGISSLAGSIASIAGDQEAIDAFLDKTNIPGITGKSRDYYSNLLMTKNDDRLIYAIEQMITDINAKNGAPDQQPAGASTGAGVADAEMQANTVIIYGGNVIDNRAGAGGGSGKTGFGSGVGVTNPTSAYRR